MQQESLSKFLQEHDHVLNIFNEKISLVEDEVDADIFEISKAEADENMELVAEIMDRNVDSFPAEESAALKRYLHTIKGGFRMAGANRIGMLAHRIESLLDYVESRNLDVLTIKPLLEKEIEKIHFLMKDPFKELDLATLAWLDNVVFAGAEKTSQEEQKEERKEVPQKQQMDVQRRAEQQFIRVPAQTVDSVISDAGEIRLTRTAMEDAVYGVQRHISELASSAAKLARMLKEVEVQSESQIQSRRDQMLTESNFDPLEFDRFTRMQELTRLMNEAVLDVEETLQSLSLSTKIQSNNINQQAIHTNSLLSQLLKVRLVPFDSVTSRFYKIARNTSAELGKKVVLRILNEKTEIDRLILDKIISPIEHLLRNSIAHGIESEDKRRAAGKTPLGQITINVVAEGNHTNILISDDGAGINLEKVRSIAIKKGLLKEGEKVDDDTLVNMIFQSGFSTADSVSQVSGRGVGMDVVKSEIVALGGSIRTETKAGRGTTFTLVLPLGIATGQTVLCSAQNSLVGIPVVLVDEITSVSSEVVTKAYKTGEITLSGEVSPFYYMGDLLGISDRKGRQGIKEHNAIIKVRYLSETMVLHADKVSSVMELLIRTPGTTFGKIRGVMGMTILGDGTQGIIINPITFLEHFNTHYRDLVFTPTSEQAVPVSTVKTVMVVDDSITIRKLSSRILERNGFNVILAKDGEDALEVLQEGLPNIILSDIEMPKMDGFELLKNLQNTPKYKNIPVIMITSRTADKHQKHAFDLGAKGFLGKPYKEEELLDLMEQLLSETESQQ